SMAILIIDPMHIARMMTAGGAMRKNATIEPDNISNRKGGVADCNRISEQLPAPHFMALAL
ncbi:MAG: hypothetical protein KJ927_14275, partial [Candidatus Eisenbacteria bacterium]|nr:hypothetical protein [Candidatus Eisenbacteria bacterium]